MENLEQLSRTNLYFADFETTTDRTQYFKNTNDSTITLWVIKHIGGETWTGVNMKSFVEQVKTFPHRSVILFHNLSYDVRFIWTWLVDNGWYLQSGYVDKENPKNPLYNGNKIKAYYGNDSKTFSLIGDGSKVYRMDMRFSDSHNIVFKCSMKLLPLSVAKIGKSIGMDKHNDETSKVDFYDVEPMDDINKYPKSYVEYAIRDVEIVRVFYKMFLDFLDDIQNSLEIKPNLRIKSVPMTIGSLSMQLQERYFKSHNVFNDKNTIKRDNQIIYPKLENALKISGQQDELARKFYLGGLTLFNLHSLKETFENGAYVDINSSYPHSMTKPLPYGFATKNKPKSGENGRTYLTFYHIKVRKAKIKNPLGLCPLPDWLGKLKQKTTSSYTKNNIQLMFNFECYYLDKEFEMLKNFYDFDYEILQTYYIFAKPYLKDYTEKLYTFKANAKDKNYREFYKLLLNNGYGKYGQNTAYDAIYSCVGDYDYDIRMNQPEIKERCIATISRFPYNKTYEPRKINCRHYLYRDNLQIIKYKRTNTNAFDNYNVWVAATITSYSRIHLMDAILKCGNDIGNVKYCDTDSMLLADGSYTKNIKLDDSKLGYWKVEYDKCKFNVLGKKLYKVETQDKKEIYKGKGVSAEHRKELIDRMLKDDDKAIYLVGGKRTKVQTNSGWIITDVDVVINNDIINSGVVNPKYENKSKEH